MNSIGVDFKLKSIQLDNKNIKLQIVPLSINSLIFSGIQLVKKDLELSLLVIIKALKQLL